MPNANDIHDTAYIGVGVTLGEGVTVGPGAVLLGPMTIGDRVWIGPNCVLGSPPEVSSLPQNSAWNGDTAHRGVVIGDDVVIRELSTVHQGSLRPTTIGSGTWLLNSTYVAHDGRVGSHVTLSAGVRLGGHVEIGDHANLGMNAVVHQRRHVGAGAMVGMGSPVTRDVPPFAKAFGSPARLRGVNAYVLRKLGVDEAVITDLTAAYASGTDVSAFAEDEVAGPLFRAWLADAEIAS